MSITLLSVPLFNHLSPAPGAPQALHVQDVSCNSIQVSWLPPNSSLSGGLPLISYRVRYNGTKLYNRGEDKLEVEIPGLQPNTPYAISVSANNTFGWGEEAQGSTTTMARMTASLFRVIAAKSKTITFRAQILPRNLQCDMSPNDKPVTFTQRRKEVAGLTPNTQYTIHCVAKNDNGTDTCIEKTLNVTTRKNCELLISYVYDLKHINFTLHIRIHLNISLHSTAPPQVTNVRRDGHSWVAGEKINQPITWDEPQGTEDNEEPETYVVRYKKPSPDAVTDTTETRNNKTTFVLRLPLPQQAVTYIVSVAGKADTGRGNFSDELTLNYSSMCAYCMPCLHLCLIQILK